MEYQKDRLVYNYVYAFMDAKKQILYDYKGNPEKLLREFCEFMKEEYQYIYNKLYRDLLRVDNNYSKVNNREFYQLFYSFIQGEIEEIKKVHSDYDVTIEEEFLKIKNYIFKYLRKSVFYLNLVDRDEIIKEASEYFADKLLMTGHDSEEIEEHFCDNIINRYAISDNIRANSVEEPVFSFDKAKDKLSDVVEIVKEKIIELTKKPMLMLAIIAVILTVGGVTYGMAKSFQRENFNNNMEIVSLIDDYAYGEIDSSYDVDFGMTLDNLLAIYPEYLSRNEGNNNHYEQIPLYRAYDSINVGIEYYNKAGICKDINPLKIMDSLFVFFQQSLGDNKGAINYRCYVEYIYNMMLANGISMDKYETSVRRYISQLSNYKLISPYSLLDKDDQRIINDMLEEYDKKVYQKLVQELAKDIKNENNGMVR